MHAGCEASPKSLESRNDGYKSGKSGEFPAISTATTKQSTGNDDRGLRTAGKPFFVAGPHGKVMPHYRYKNLSVQR